MSINKNEEYIYQVHPLVEGLDGERLVVDAGEAVDQVSAEGRVDTFRRKLSQAWTVVGPRAPESVEMKIL